MRMLIASSSKGKLREIKSILGDIYPDMVTPPDIGLDMDVDEDGDTFLANATKKAVAFMQASGLDTLADDSGLCVEALDGAPGVHSARFAGSHGDDEANKRKLMDEMRGQTNRKAFFVSCIVLARTDGSIVSAQAESYGLILDSPVGQSGFGYDPLFYDEQFGKTYAELTMEQKNSVSHRAKALNKLYEQLKQG